MVMALYNDTVMNNFMNPQNVEKQKIHQEQIYGSPVCGRYDAVFKIKVDENDVSQIAFTPLMRKVYRSSSMATQMIIGKTVEEALRLQTRTQLIGGSLSSKVKIHCSVLADHAIESAICDDYAQKNNKTYADQMGFDPMCR